jgi:hypothetical protein
MPVWFNYIQNVYGFVPSESDFPLNLNYFSVLYKSFLINADINISKWIISDKICPTNKNQNIMSGGWDPSLFS